MPAKVRTEVPMSRSARRSSTLALLLAAALVATIAPAAVYAPIGDATLLGRAPAAALVRAVASESAVVAPGVAETRTRFEVIESLRGPLGRDVEVAVVGGELGDGRTLVVPDVPRFEAGRVYLLLLAKREDGRYGVVEQALGAFDVVSDADGTRWASRLAFSRKGERPVAATGPDGALRAETEPMRRLDAFAAAIREASGPLEAEMTAYVGEPHGATVPVRETRGLTALWDSNWNTQRARWSPSATATTYACDMVSASYGQAGVNDGDGGHLTLISAVSTWSTVPNQAKGAEIFYNVPVFLDGACPQTAQVNSGQVVVAFDDTSMFNGTAIGCAAQGNLAIGAWLTDGTSNQWKGETYQTVRAGQVWVRRTDCAVYPTDLFYAVLLHGLGNTLGLSNSDLSQNANDVDPSDNLKGVMVSTFGATPPAGLGSDDIDGACWLYGPCGNTQEPLQAAFYFANPVYRNTLVQFTDRSRGTPQTWSWTFGDGSAAATTPNPTHTYTAPGSYEVTLTVTRTVNSAVETSSITQRISVLTDLAPKLIPAPAAVQVGSPVSIGLTMTKGKAKSPATLDFDDGSGASPASADGVTFAATSHTYGEPGVYYVRATAQDVDDAVPPGVTGPENFATTTSVVTVYPLACTAPAGPPTMTLPATVRLGNNLFVSWTKEPGFDPRIDRYEVQVSGVETFAEASTSTFLTEQDYYVYPVYSVPASGMLWARVRMVKQCATRLVSDYSNVASTMVERPATVVNLSSTSPSMFYRIGSNAPVPTSEFCFLSATYSTMSATLALSLSGTDAAAFTLDKTSLVVSPGEVSCVRVSPKADTLTTAGYRSASLVWTYDISTMSVPVSILVSASNPPPSGTQLRAAASKLNFSAPTGQTPLPTTLGVSIVPPPQAGQTIELLVARRPSWLVVDQPPGGLKFDANGQIVLTVRVDRSKREYAGAPQSGYLDLELAASLPTVSISLPVLDMEPYTVESGQGSSRNAKGGDVAALATLDESPGSFFVASAVEAPGLEGAFFSTDGWLRNNTDVDDLPVEFWYTPAGKDGTADPNVLKATTAFKANRTVRLASLLSTVFGLPAGSTGMVEMYSRFAGAFTLRSRTQSDTGGDPALLFGAEMPGVFATDGVDASGGEAVVPGIVSSTASRTNLILANPTKQGVTAAVTVRSTDGATSSTLSGIYVPPFSRQQIDGVAAAAGFPSLSLGSVSVKATSGGGRVVPVASVIDNASNSFSLVKGRRVGSGAFRALIVPGVARLTGANDTRYRTALRIANGASTAAQLQLVYRYVAVDLGGKTGEAVVNVTIPAYGSLPADQSDDALAELFGLTSQTYGWISIEGEVSKVTAAAAVSAQVDNADAGKGRTAAQIVAVPSTGREITWLGGPVVRFAGAEKSSVRRSNLVFVETAGVSTTLRATLTDSLGTVVAVKDVVVKPFEYVQVNDLFGASFFDVGDGPFSEMDVSVSVTAGAGRVLSFVSSIVNDSRNPEIYVLAPSGP